MLVCGTKTIWGIVSWPTQGIMGAWTEPSKLNKTSLIYTTHVNCKLYGLIPACTSVRTDNSFRCSPARFLRIHRLLLRTDAKDQRI